MVRISIVGAGEAEPVEYPDGSNTKAVKEDLLGGFGKGILKQNGAGVLSETVTGDYEYHVTVTSGPAVGGMIGQPTAAATALPPGGEETILLQGLVLDTLKMQGKFMAKQGRVMGSMLEVIEEFADKDCYDRISESTKPRELTKDDYFRAYSVRSSDLTCMVTGISQKSLTTSTSSMPKNPVTVAHLLARTAVAHESFLLGYHKADIEKIRNSILFCKGIEEAFDHKYISFVPIDIPFSPFRYKLHIWVDAVKSDPIYEGATETIGSFDGAPLNLMVGTTTHNPFNRALSYQAFRAFKTWGRKLGHTELLEDSDISVYQGSYQAKRAKYAKQLAKDITGDAEDEDEYSAEGAESDDEDV